MRIYSLIVTSESFLNLHVMIKEVYLDTVSVHVFVQIAYEVQSLSK